ncbi:hypothetical protein PR202_ga07366 [Eleusine coracana subsp. coracana]|uniref:Uncharacterized protein n=1 Tax=Eleusine coracana subsp. coracana TaxID=191504 RepID=A0AAV5BYC6_ELECO|nr:hypothetical protein PR202_ga07366 [Eleusine coracana subsp. coracana]
MVPRGAISDAVYYSCHGLEPEHEHGPPDGGALTTRLVTYRFPSHGVIPSPPVGKGASTCYLVDYSGRLLVPGGGDAPRLQVDRGDDG